MHRAVEVIHFRKPDRAPRPAVRRHPTSRDTVGLTRALDPADTALDLLKHYDGNARLAIRKAVEMLQYRDGRPSGTWAAALHALLTGLTQA